MKVMWIAAFCLCVSVLVAAPVLAIGFDPQGAQEADGLSREFDDATRLQQMEQAPKLPPPPLVTVPKPAPPSEQRSGVSTDPSALLQTNQQMDSEQAKQALQQAERQLQQERKGGFWHTAWRFLLWSTIGTALSWAVWSWMVRRASEGLKPS